jgi:hypothetical protein
MSDLIPDFNAATDFLLGFAPSERWCLVAIEPDPPVGKTARVVAAHFDESSVAGAHAWMRQYAAWNLYYTANQASPDCTTTPTKEQIVGLRCLHADVDQPNALAEIRAMEPKTTAIVFSGGGHHPIWRFPANAPPNELLRVEAANRAIAESVAGGDHCWNCNRLLRLPGTVNWLSRAKRARGRKPELARLIEADWSRTWSLDDPVPKPPVVANGHDPDAEPTRPRDDSRSGMAFRAAAEFAKGRSGDYEEVRDELLAALRTDPEITGWVDEKGLKTGERELRRIWAKAALADLPPRYSHDALALRFTEKHCSALRYVAKWGDWMAWDETRWRQEETLKAFDLARAICRAAALEIADYPKMAGLARGIADAKTVAAVERLAKADREHAMTHDQWDAEPWVFNLSPEKGQL